jgi:hypothetical protein
VSEDPTNQERASRARSSISAYLCCRDGHLLLDKAVERETNVSDLLADLMHYCREEGLSFDSALQTAMTNFEAEKGT